MFQFAHSKSSNSGFTLIELIIVIIILGILAAVAVPKFVNLSSDAQTNTTASVAAALTSANGINYGSRKSNSSQGAAVADCTDVGGLLQGGLPTGYTIVSATVAADTTVTCTLNGPSSSSATFSATGIS